MSTDNSAVIARLKKQRDELAEAFEETVSAIYRYEMGIEKEQAEQSTVPEGWKLVPIKPTENMRFAGAGVSCSPTIPVEVYESMIDAAPQPPAKQPAAPEGWRKMESAPTNGTQLLLRCPTDDATISVLGLYSGGQWVGAFWTGIDWARGILSPDGWLPIPKPGQRGRE